MIPFLQDDINAAAYWANHEVKKWVVQVTAGPPKAPTLSIKMYVRARTEDGAVRCAKENLLVPAKRPQFRAKLAGPYELGCKAGAPKNLRLFGRAA